MIFASVNYLSNEKISNKSFAAQAIQPIVSRLSQYLKMLGVFSTKAWSAIISTTKSRCKIKLLDTIALFSTSVYYANNGQFEITIQELADKSHMSRKHAHTILNEFERDGLIQKWATRNRSTCIKVIPIGILNWLCKHLAISNLRLQEITGIYREDSDPLNSVSETAVLRSSNLAVEESQKPTAQDFLKKEEKNTEKQECKLELIKSLERHEEKLRLSAHQEPEKTSIRPPDSAKQKDLDDILTSEIIQEASPRYGGDLGLIKKVANKAFDFYGRAKKNLSEMGLRDWLAKENLEKHKGEQTMKERPSPASVRQVIKDKDRWLAADYDHSVKYNVSYVAEKDIPRAEFMSKMIRLGDAQKHGSDVMMSLIRQVNEFYELEEAAGNR